MSAALNRWPQKRLGDICEFKYGKSLPEPARSGGAVPVYGSNGVVGGHDVPLTASETIVIGRKGSHGEVNYSDTPCWPIDTTYFVDSTATAQHLGWLKYRLAGAGLNQMNRAAAVPGLNREDAYRVEILLPPLEVQRRIAVILDQAETVRCQRRAALVQLDSLAQSIFLDMFGDPVTNDRGWPESLTLGEVAGIASGVTKGRSLEGKVTRELPYLAVANVQDKALRLESIKYIEATEGEIRRYRLEKNDLLLTEGGDPDKLGRGTLWQNELPECIHQNHIFRVRLTSDVLTPLFLNWLVGSPRGKKYFLRSAKQTTGIASINMTQLRGFPLLVPPLPLQQTFATRIQAIESLKATHRIALTELDALFASLQQRAFAGEL